MSYSVRALYSSSVTMTILILFVFETIQLKVACMQTEEIRLKNAHGSDGILYLLNCWYHTGQKLSSSVYFKVWRSYLECITQMTKLFSCENHFFIYINQQNNFCVCIMIRYVLKIASVIPFLQESIDATFGITMLCLKNNLSQLSFSVQAMYFPRISSVTWYVCREEIPQTHANHSFFECFIFSDMKSNEIMNLHRRYAIKF